VSYPALAADLQQLLAQLSLQRVALVGHSMGGKAAMWLALTCAECVDRLVVADIAPVTYPNRFETLLDALAGLPLHQIRERKEADRRLAAAVPDAAVRGYLLQNLVRGADGAWRWRVNLPALRGGLGDILAFPEPPAGAQFPGPALFLYGGRSDYVRPEHQPHIHQYFPYARLRALSGAGHWLYAEQPQAFIQALQGFLAG
jgi:pimeloyl-ACP methyl ester carboxylesterase